MRRHVDRGDDDYIRPRDELTWPWPIGSWIVPLFWLVVVTLAMLSWCLN